MRTLVISDLHLGSLSRSGLLERTEVREALLEALDGIDRLVLLGDVLELRHGPLREAMDAAQPFFEDLGTALGQRELIITAGNHDHALVEPWLSRRGEESEPPPLAAEQLFAPRDASPALERIAAWVAPARVTVAYPGLYLRHDVYATHGHYLDCHLTVPTLERLTMAAMMRLLRRPPASLSGAGDYESICAPLFAWRDAVARDARTGSALNGLATVTAWQALGGGDSSGEQPAASASARARKRRRKLHVRALRAGFPVAVAALNRAGLGPLKADISGGELRRAGLHAMGEVSDRLALRKDVHVIFGHTHRTGPLPGDDVSEWRSARGARLWNTGSWTYASIFLTDTPGASPYWPGGAVLVEDDGPPVVKHLLAHMTRAQLRPGKRRTQAAAPQHAAQQQAAPQQPPQPAV